MNSETRAPNISRDSMSWPSPSVPSGNRQVPPEFQTGGARTASRNCSIGECGAMKSAASATSMTAPTTVRPNTAPRFSRNVAQNAAKRRWLGENADAFVRRQSERDVSGHGVSWG